MPIDLTTETKSNGTTDLTPILQTIVMPIIQCRDVLGQILEETKKGNKIAVINDEHIRKFLLMDADKGPGRKRAPEARETLAKALSIVDADADHNKKKAAEKVFRKGCGYASPKSLEVVLGRQYRKILEERNKLAALEKSKVGKSKVESPATFKSSNPLTEKYGIIRSVKIAIAALAVYASASIADAAIFSTPPPGNSFAEHSRVFDACAEHARCTGNAWFLRLEPLKTCVSRLFAASKNNTLKSKE